MDQTIVYSDKTTSDTKVKRWLYIIWIIASIHLINGKCFQKACVYVLDYKIHIVPQPLNKYLVALEVKKSE